MHPHLFKVNAKIGAPLQAPFNKGVCEVVLLILKVRGEFAFLIFPETPPSFRNIHQKLFYKHNQVFQLRKSGVITKSLVVECDLNPVVIQQTQSNN